MRKENLLKEYKENVRKLLEKASESGLSDHQIKKLLHRSFVNLQAKNHHKVFPNQFKLSAFFILLVSVFIYVLLNVHAPTSSIILRNVQGLTYPALRIVRTLSVPIIKLFPSLTDLYDESCLVENPYFYLSDMECWPCEHVHSVMDLTGVEGINGFENMSDGTPFIIKVNSQEVLFKDLQDLYKNYTSELSNDSRRVKVINSNVSSLDELFNSDEEKLPSNLHIHWRINKMATARVIRKLFPKPYFLPERSGQAVERFLNIDGPTAQHYRLPSTECSYVFVIQGSGERTIALIPPKECKEKCKAVSVHMKSSYALFYNWWYWRPVSLPVKNNTNLSISYINSFC